ncbi:hypothetical protein [Caballeronia udeis]|uniref:hypothetical protein n=1 Tax=Caballeronia udeis TaxID=1232866 RepID=UPI0012E71218
MAIGGRRRVREGRIAERYLRRVDRLERHIGREQKHCRRRFLHDWRGLAVGAKQHAVFEVQAEPVERVLIVRIVFERDVNHVGRDVIAGKRGNALALAWQHFERLIGRVKGDGAHADLRDFVRSSASVAG